MAAINPNYTRYSNYNTNAGIEAVRFAATSAVLEVELNEAQDAANDKLRKTIKLLCTDGLSVLNTMTYSGGTFTIANCNALLQGILLYISSLSISAASGDNIYLDTWVDMVGPSGTLYQYGNTQGSTVPNYLIEASVGVETSARQVRRYTLSKTTGTAGHTYLLLAQIASGVLSVKTSLIKSNFQAVQSKTEQIFTATAGQTLFTLTAGTYVPGKGQLDIFLNGIRQPRASFTETSTTSFTLKATNITAGIEVAAVFG
jgi:hypothetical protein